MVSRLFLRALLIAKLFNQSFFKDQARYDRYRLVRVHLETDEQVSVFQELETKSDSFIFYGHARAPGQKLTVMVAAHKIPEYNDILVRYNVSAELLVSKRTLFVSFVNPS